MPADFRHPPQEANAPVSALLMELAILIGHLSFLPFLLLALEIVLCFYCSNVRPAGLRHPPQEADAPVSASLMEFAIIFGH